MSNLVFFDDLPECCCFRLIDSPSIYIKCYYNLSFNIYNLSFNITSNNFEDLELKREVIPMPGLKHICLFGQLQIGDLFSFVYDSTTGRYRGHKFIKCDYNLFSSISNPLVHKMYVSLNSVINKLDLWIFQV